MLDDLLAEVTAAIHYLFGEYRGIELRPGQEFTLDFDIEGNIKSSFD